MEIGSFYPTSPTTNGVMNQTLQLKEGQMVYGKVDKILSDSTVQVQIGSFKVTAQLDQSVSQDARHWFSVRFINNQLHLDVMPNINKDTLGTDELLFKQLQLEQKPTITAIVQMLKENNLPIAKDVVQLASSWIESTKSLATGLEALKLLLQKNLPLSKESFLAFVSLLEEPSTINQLNKLKELLMENPKLSEKESQLLQLLNRFTQSEGEKMGSLLVNKLVNEVILATKNAENAKIILTTLQINPMKLANHEEISQLMNQIKRSLLEKNASLLTTQLEQLNSGVKNQLSNHPITNQLQGLINVAKLPVGVTIINKTIDHVFSELNQVFAQQPTPANPSIDSQTMNQLKQLLGGNFDENLNLSSEQKVLILQLVKDLQVDRLNLANSETVKNYFQDLLKNLGLSHEKMLASFSKLNQSDAIQDNSLKSLLLAIRNESTGDTQELASKLVARLTGFQLNSVESNQLLQFNYQIPIPFWNQTKDLTISWTGKKDKQGKIDGDHCRILFYLDFEKLGMTMVDMQVQNRMIHVRIINELNHLKKVSEPFIQSLQDNLEKLDYQLSSIQFVKPSKEEKSLKASNQTDHSIITPTKHVGVDIRI